MFYIFQHEIDKKLLILRCWNLQNIVKLWWNCCKIVNFLRKSMKLSIFCQFWVKIVNFLSILSQNCHFFVNFASNSCQNCHFFVNFMLDMLENAEKYRKMQFYVGKPSEIVIFLSILLVIPIKIVIFLLISCWKMQKNTEKYNFMLENQVKLTIYC